MPLASSAKPTIMTDATQVGLLAAKIQIKPAKVSTAPAKNTLEDSGPIREIGTRPAAAACVAATLRLFSRHVAAAAAALITKIRHDRSKPLPIKTDPLPTGEGPPNVTMSPVATPAPTTAANNNAFSQPGDGVFRNLANRQATYDRVTAATRTATLGKKCVIAHRQVKISVPSPRVVQL